MKTPNLCCKVRPVPLCLDERRLRLPIPADSELIEALLDGDEQAYVRLFERHEQSVKAVTTAVLGDYHAAQDATQEAFLTAYRRLSGLRKRSAFGPWVLKIARRQAIQMARKRQRRQDAVKHATTPLDPSDNGRLDKPNSQLLETIMRLPKHERTAVMLHYFDGHPAKTIAEMTGRSVGTVTMRLSRARTRLKKWIRESSL